MKDIVCFSTIIIRDQYTKLPVEVQRAMKIFSKVSVKLE